MQSLDWLRVHSNKWSWRILDNSYVNNLTWGQESEVGGEEKTKVNVDYYDYYFNY